MRAGRCGRREVAKWTQKQATTIMQEWNHTHPCVDCTDAVGRPIFYNYWQMQFDHGIGLKTYNLGTEGKKLEEAILRLEMAMCDVVCCNCHAERTHARSVGR